MAKRRVRTKDQLPVAQTREQRLAQKQIDFSQRYVGIDTSSSDDASAIAIMREDHDGVRRFLGMEVIESPSMTPDRIGLISQQDVIDAIKETLRSYDFRAIHRDA
jgi:hypothetical protein